jgi:hypothetical protein
MKRIILILLFISNLLIANNIGKIVALDGEATILREGKIIQVNKDSVFEKDDTLNTKDNTKLQILFLDDTIISVGQNSTLKINEYLFEEKNTKAEFSMARGIFRTITGKIGKIAPENFKLKTKTASIGIRGTQIITVIEDNNEKIFCTEGQIEVKNNLTKDTVIVNKGEFLSFKENSTEKLNIQEIKQNDIQEINKNIAIKENLPIDNISLPTETTDILKNQNIPIPTNKTLASIENKETVIDIPKTDNSSTDNSSTENSSTENLSGLDDSNNFINRTPASFFNSTNSTASYIGSFPTELSSSNYMVNSSRETVAIPSDTRISMDIDFAKSNNQISNGKVNISDVGNGTSRVLTFEGDMDGRSGNLSLYPRGETHGDTGSAKLYGDTANYMKGNINFRSSDNVEINSEFNAKKQ